MKRFYILLITSCLLLSAFSLPLSAFSLPLSAQESAFVSTGNEDLDSLTKWMEGDFSSEEHSKRDTAYFDIDLHMKRIWHDREDGVWFYVEQSLASTPEAPYRQRIYNVSALEEGMFESIIYTLPEPDSVVGGWQDIAVFADLDVDDLKKRRGCEVYMQFSGQAFFGSTHGFACESLLNGASYATTEVEIRPFGLMSWDRGYDSADEQVWGAVKGGYVFIKE